MKKTILTTTLALGLGVGGFTAADNAEASEQNINKQELAEMAQSHSSVLDDAPLHEGEYHYNFNLNDVDYDFKSDGVNYTWAYNGGNEAQPETDEAATEQSAPQVTEAPVQEAQPAEVVEETQEAPQVEEAQEAPAQNVQQPEQNTEPAAPATTGGSTKAQFLEAGGTEAMWESIVMPESSGDPNAVNELGYQGLGQTKESWGTGSVAEQTAGMLNYAEERYGSVSEAIEFREANNWW